MSWTPPEQTATIETQAISTLIECLGNDAEKVMGEVIDIYLKQSPELVGRILNGAKDGLHAEVQRASHQLKSTSANLGALKLADMCSELETMGRSGDLKGSETASSSLAEEFKLVMSDLMTVRQSLES